MSLLLTSSWLEGSQFSRPMLVVSDAILGTHTHSIREPMRTGGAAARPPFDKGF